jgi:hypothetical protein
MINNTGSSQLVRETQLDAENPAREDPMHKTIMDKFLEDTNQGNPSQWDSCGFYFIGNISAPLMAILKILGLTLGLLVWLWTTPNVPNSLKDS